MNPKLKQRTLKELTKESETLYSTLLVVRNLYIFYIGLLALTAAGGVALSGKLAAMFQREDASLISLLVRSLTFSHPLRSDGSFNVLIFLAGCASAAASAALSAFIFHTILQVFKNIKDGETPFTLKNAGFWKTCYKIYAVLTVLCFLASFLLRFGALPLFLTYLLSSCFFLAMSLIFEYGSQLQQESDETL